MLALAGLFAPLSLEGCRSEPASTEPPIVVKDGVYVATKAALAVADDHVDLDAADLEREYLPGDVIVNGNPAAPYLRRVVGLSRSGHTVSIKTEPASLEDVFFSGHIHGDSLTDGSLGLAPANLTPTNLSGPTAKGWTFKINNTTLTANGAGSVDFTDGYFELDKGLDFDVGFADGRLKKLRFGVNGNFSAKLAYTIAANGYLSLSDKGLVPIFRKEDPFVYWVGDIPIAGMKIYEAYIGVSGTFEGSISAHESVALNAKVNAGVGCEENGCATFGRDQSFTFQADPGEISVLGKGNLTVPIVAKATIRFFDAAGLYIQLQPYVGLAATSDAAGVNAGGIVGVKSVVGGEVKIFSKVVFGGFQGNLFDWSANFGNVSFPATPATAPLCQSQLDSPDIGATRCDRATFVDEYEGTLDCIRNGGVRAASRRRRRRPSATTNQADTRATTTSCSSASVTVAGLLASTHSARDAIRTRSFARHRRESRAPRRSRASALLHPHAVRDPRASSSRSGAQPTMNAMRS